MDMVRIPLAPAFLSSEIVLYTLEASITACTATYSLFPARGMTVGPSSPGIMASTLPNAGLGTLAMRYFLFSAHRTLRMELTTSSIWSFLEPRALSLGLAAAWDSSTGPTSTSLFIFRVDPVDTRSTM